MYPPSRVFLLCLLTGSSCAVFYTKSSDNDYPRIGRRSFYTSGNGNHYPRIGRRNAAASHSAQLLLPVGSEFGEFPARSLDKRNLFTQGSGKYGNYPRVGRSSEEVSGEEFLTDRNKFLEKLAAGIKDGVDVDGDSSESSMEEGAGFGYSLDIMFMAFDADNDGSLSKEEFTSGMKKYRQQNPLC